MGTKRNFSEAEKLSMLKESERPGESISSVARRHKMATSQLFVWRKQLHSGLAQTADNGIPSQCQIDHYKKSLKKLLELEDRLESRVTNKLMSDLSSGKISAYNSATAFSSLANAVSKIQMLKFDLFDRLANFPAATGVVDEGPIEDLAERLAKKRAAEKIVIDIVRSQMKQDEAAGTINEP